MKLVSFIFAALLLMPFASHASSPGMDEGPPGCSWSGTITGFADNIMQVRLDKKLGACMSLPGQCGKSGDLVNVSVMSNLYPLNAKVTVWVDQTSASLKMPICTAKRE